MKIETATESRMEFKNLKYGKCFKSGGEVYIKAKATNDADTANAVRLSDGLLAYFEGNRLVLPVGAKVTIY